MKNFFLWHYTEGRRNLIRIWEDYLDFFWNYFSIGRFLRTLLSPWRRDVARVMARGPHPILFLQALLENIVTRILGAIVKSLVIIGGLIVETVALFLGFFLLIIWLLIPVAFMISLGEVFFAILNGPDLLTAFWFLVLLTSAFATVISLAAQRNKESEYRSMSLAELFEEEWFERVWNRLGIFGAEADKNVLNSKEALGEFLRTLDLTPEDFSRIVAWEMQSYLEKRKKRKFWLRENLVSIMPIGRQWAFAYTVHLDRYSYDLSQRDYSDYRDARLIGKENELDELKQLLVRPSQNNVILVGEPGVGRETIIHTLAREIRESKLGEPLVNKRILELDLKRILADNAAGGESDKILGMYFNEAAYAGNVIFVLKDIHEFIDADGRDIAPVLSQFLAFPTFQIIGTTNAHEFHSRIEKKENIMKFCEKILVEEASQEDTLRVMFYKLEKLESVRVVFTYQALQEIAKLADRYIAGAPFPEKALDLMEEVLLHWENAPTNEFITASVADEAVSAKIKVPLGEMKGEESEKLMNLEEHLHERVIGQDFAIRQIAETMRRARIGMAQKNKPLGSFLFLGPTGVGKTESSKALAEAYFGEENRMIRLDMSEYQMQNSIDRLIGSQSSGEEGYLVSKVKESPFALLLLDEIEKAHPDILNLFLQILDEGYLTDAFGKKISFRNLLIIATSNAGAEIIRNGVQGDLDPKEISKQVIDYTIKQNIFRPEFLNRFEGVIFFQPLSPEEVFQVANLQLARYAKRLKEQENIEVTFGTGIAEKIVAEAFDPVFGARAIERYIQDRIGDSIVKRIVSGQLKKGVNFTFESSEMM